MGDISCSSYAVLDYGSFKRQLGALPSRSIDYLPGFTVDDPSQHFRPELYCLVPSMETGYMWFYGSSFAIIMFCFLAVFLFISPSRRFLGVARFLKRFDFRPAVRGHASRSGRLHHAKNPAGGVSAILLLALTVMGSVFYSMQFLDPSQNPVTKSIAEQETKTYDILLETYFTFVDQIATNETYYRHHSLCSRDHFDEYIQVMKGNTQVPFVAATNSTDIKFSVFLAHQQPPSLNGTVTDHKFRTCTVHATVALPFLVGEEKLRVVLHDPEESMACGPSGNRTQYPLCLLATSNSTSMNYFRLNTLTSVPVEDEVEKDIQRDMSSVSLMSDGGADVSTLKLSSSLENTQLCCSSQGTKLDQNLLFSLLLHERAQSPVFGNIFGGEQRSLRGFEIMSGARTGAGGTDMSARAELIIAASDQTASLVQQSASITGLMTNILSLAGGAIGMQVVLRYLLVSAASILAKRKWRIGTLLEFLLGILLGLIPVFGQFLAMMWSRSLRLSCGAFVSFVVELALLGISFFFTTAFVPSFLSLTTVGEVISKDPKILYAWRCFFGSLIIGLSLFVLLAVWRRYVLLVSTFSQWKYLAAVAIEEDEKCDSDEEKSSISSREAIQIAEPDDELPSPAVAAQTTPVVLTLGDLSDYVLERKSGSWLDLLGWFSVCFLLPGFGFVYSQQWVKTKLGAAAGMLWLGLFCVGAACYWLSLLTEDMALGNINVAGLILPLSVLAVGLYVLVLTGNNIVHVARGLRGTRPSVVMKVPIRTSVESPLLLDHSDGHDPVPSV